MGQICCYLEIQKHGSAITCATRILKQNLMRPLAAVQMNRRRKPWLIAFAFAGLHLAVFLLFLAVQGFALGGEGRLLWALWLPIDFPVSILVGIGFDYLPDTDTASKALRTWWPHIVHGLFGTLWWFLVPFFIVKVVERRKVKRKKA